MEHFHLFYHLLFEAESMLKYLSGQGKNIPSEIGAHIYRMQNQLRLNEKTSDISDDEQKRNVFSEQDVEHLMQLHHELSQMVAPAKPKTIALMAYEKQNPSKLYWLGPVRLIRGLSLLAIISLLVIVLVSTSSHVNLQSINDGLFQSEGWILLLNQVFLLGCASLGACFACLNKASRYIKEDTFDPKFDSTYWILIIMGLMGGLMIAELIPVRNISSSGESSLTGFEKPVAALLGGFSADLIYMILAKFTETISQLFGIQNTRHLSKETQLDGLHEKLTKLEQRMQATDKDAAEPLASIAAKEASETLASKVVEIKEPVGEAKVKQKASIVPPENVY
ncbi:MAG: hypothetical protein OXE99_15245 [Cellvibrionales bacterium]|nr:hypothetical protein [Cellvibrionales bacterium]